MLEAEPNAAHVDGDHSVKRLDGIFGNRLHRALDTGIGEIDVDAAGALNAGFDVALDVFRARQWRAGIDRKLSIIRETYGMLNAESQSARGEVLEVAIVALIVIEIVLSLFR